MKKESSLSISVRIYHDPNHIFKQIDVGRFASVPFQSYELGWSMLGGIFFGICIFLLQVGEVVRARTYIHIDM